MQAATAIDHWKGEFGDNYTSRQTDTVVARVAVWREILPMPIDFASVCDTRHSILEVGANVGDNLEALQCILPIVDLFACEPNDRARQYLIDRQDGILPKDITADTADSLSFPTDSIDLVFTTGVLIHVPPDKLEQSMREIHRVSKRWIICGEYFAPKEEEIPYRGQSGLMWRRDYGSLYMDLFPDLKCTKTMFAWKRTTGLDNLLFWVFEK